MKGLRVGVTFFIVLIIFLLSMFQMQLRGYEKMGRVGEFTIYYKDEEACSDMEEVFFSDNEYDYYFPCLMSDRYIVKQGFEEQLLVEALENNDIEIEDIEGVIDFNKVLISD